MELNTKIEKVIAKNARGEVREISVTLPDGWHPWSEKPIMKDGEELKKFLVMIAEDWDYEDGVSFECDFGYYSLHGDSNGWRYDWETMNDWYEGQFVYYIAWRELPQLGKIIS